MVVIYAANSAAYKNSDSVILYDSMFLPYAVSIDNRDRSLNANPAYNTRYISVDRSDIIRA